MAGVLPPLDGAKVRVWDSPVFQNDFLVFLSEKNEFHVRGASMV